MLMIVGAIIVLLCVVGGFIIEGGHLAVLVQPIEIMIIVGAAAGSLLISSPGAVVRAIVHQIAVSMKGSPYTKENYMELLMLLYELIRMGKANALALEPQIENPEGSDIFKRYPLVMNDHHVIAFLCDTLKVQISSPMSPYDLDDLMAQDIAAMHQEEELAPATVSRLGDAMPGLGIVAAGLGVVITMGRLTEGKEVIGHSVASALVGTLLGILISYGFMQPLAAKMEYVVTESGKYLRVIQVALVAFAKELSPKACVEIARRVIPPEVRPTFKEVDEKSSNVGKG